MEYVAGQIFTDPLLPSLNSDQRRKVYDSMCRTLAAIHSVNVADAKLLDFGKSGTACRRVSYLIHQTLVAKY